jgi:general stress protein CsbA
MHLCELNVSDLHQAGILLITQAILILQPTHTATQKSQGTKVHGILNGTALGALLAGLVVIEYNKFAHHGIHFESPHAILGLITYSLFATQALVGIAQYFTPSVFGGVSGAKKVYKYHRAGGYLALIVSLATVAAATQTDYNQKVLHIKLWAVLVAAGLVLVGVLPRIKKQKLGF